MPRVQETHGFEAGPVMKAPLYADVALLRGVMSSCASKAGRAANSKQKKHSRVDSGNRRREADINSIKSFWHFGFSFEFAFLYPEGTQPRRPRGATSATTATRVPSLPSTEGRALSVSVEMVCAGAFCT